ncbi:MAG: DUF885 domain-containing protein [Lachnospiraceae bacterium]|nr:DUF885 domain-containing protein [Lachnospiraceae bacterium]
MKKRPSLSPTQILWCIALLLLFILFIISLYRQNKSTPPSDQASFNRLTRELFTSEMSANTLNMHYSLAYPEHYGIFAYEPTLPAYRPDSYAQSQSAIRETLASLDAIDPTQLSEQDALLYRLLQRKLNNSYLLNDFPFYEEPLSPSSGVQSQLPILLAEYTFREKRDVTDYLALLEQVDDYFASLLAYEQQKAAAGLSQSTYSLDRVKKQCDTIVTKDTLDSDTHFLQTTFAERIQSLLDQQKITPNEAEQYISQNNRLLRTVVQPAYETLADGLFLLEDGANVPALPAGLASKPRGQAYYEQLLISQTGSYRSIEEIKSLLQQTLNSEYKAMRDLLIEHPTLREQLDADSYTTLPCTDAESMLADLQTRMQADFPALPASDNAPLVAVKTVSPNLQDYCAPAFYLTAPVDDTDSNVIYINPKDDPDALSLYTTLAHEGFPGHLYQTVYFNRRLTDFNQNNARQLLWYGGYLEGWALYVEFYSYAYVIDMLNREGRTTDALCVELEQHNRSLLLCLYATMDLMIHYDNASREDIAQFLAPFGIKKSAAVDAVYNYIADEPCNYPKYYLGYLEILELKKALQTQSAYPMNDLAFHRFLLDAGPVDFTTLSELAQLPKN